MYSIELSELAVEQLEKTKVFDQNRILDEIEKQLTREPTRKTKRKKILKGLKPPWLQAEPVWQLRIGDYRVFYDVDPKLETVTVHAVLYKGSKTTGEIL
ncbi:MAG: type II toxin-antitoxin system RelE/ParE family toxin [Deltaproteobacteria bacterium]|nr:type II toxin-antitoxin system RelE/ParE family toxin [Deltaproteobacteria bacterium]